MWVWIFNIVLFVAAMTAGPDGALAAESPNTTTCEEFERGARFNPYDTIVSMWKIFYFWANHTEMYPIVFSLPAQNRLQKFIEVVEAVQPTEDVEWKKATLFMNPRPGTEVLFLYGGTPGAFRALIKKEQRNKERPYPEPLIKYADVRLKMVGRYLGMMCCEDLTAYALAMMEHVPATEYECKTAAATLGYRGTNGRSYLYITEKQNRQLDDEL